MFEQENINLKFVHSWKTPQSAWAKTLGTCEERMGTAWGENSR